MYSHKRVWLALFITSLLHHSECFMIRILNTRHFSKFSVEQLGIKWPRYIRVAQELTATRKLQLIDIACTYLHFYTWLHAERKLEEACVVLANSGQVKLHTYSYLQSLATLRPCVTYIQFEDGNDGTYQSTVCTRLSFFLRLKTMQIYIDTCLPTASGMAFQM